MSQVATLVEARSYPVLGGAFLILLALGLVLASWAVGTETYPFIHERIVYRFPLATLDRIYLVGLGVFALHYVAYVAHYLMVGSRQTDAGQPPALEFRLPKFVIAWFFLVGLIGTYVVGASIATPRLFDAVFGPARETASLRIWNHTWFGFVLLVSLVAGVVYCTWTSTRERGLRGALHWLSSRLSLRSGHRFLGALYWILTIAILSNIATGLMILGSVPMVSFARLPFQAYGHENIARLVHDVGTAFVVGALSGHIYFRLIPGNQWMLKTMFAGYEARS